MIEKEKLSLFFANVDHLPKGKKAILARNHALFKEAKYDVVLTIMECVPDDTYVSEKDYQMLLFVASVRCELGHSNGTYPKYAVAEAVSKMENSDNKFSDLLQQDTASNRVYPLMRRYLSMYKEPVNTFALYYDLGHWDEDTSAQVNRYKKCMPVRYEWAAAFTKQLKY